MAKKILIVILVLFVSFFLSVSCKLYALDDSSYPPRKGYCIMGGQVEGNLNRLSYEPASPYDQKVSDGFVDSFENIKEYCELDQFDSNNTCVSPGYWNIVKKGLDQAREIMNSCPACWKNFRALWCGVALSPDQSQFVRVRETSEEDAARPLVRNVDVYVSKEFKRTCFESCVNVTMGYANVKVLKAVFSVDSSDSPTKFFNKMGEKRELGSPYTLNFPDVEREPVPAGVVPFNLTAYPCDDPHYRCFCVNCHRLCPMPEVWDASSKYDCKIGDFYCWPAIIVITYIVGLVLFVIGWVMVFFVRRRRGRRTDVLQTPTRDSSRSVGHDEKGGKSAKDKSKSDPGSGSESESEATSPYPDNEKAPLPYILYPYILDSRISNYFFYHGKFIARNAKAVIAITFVLIAIAASSFAWNAFEIETDPVNLWVGPKSRTAMEKAYFEENFGPFERIQQVIITRTDPRTNQRLPIVNVEGIRVAMNLMARIKKIRVEGSGLTLDDLCYKPMSNSSQCMIQSVTEYWSSQKAFEAAFETPNRTADTNANLLSCFELPLTVCHYTNKKLPLLPSIMFGGLDSYTEDGRLVNATKPGEHLKREKIRPHLPQDYFQAKALVITIMLQNSLNQTKLLAGAIPWEREFIRILQDYQDRVPNYQFAFGSGSSVEDEINRGADSNIPIVIASYCVMFVYACFALGRFRNFGRLFIDSRIALALSGIFIVLTSILFSMAFFMAIHIKTTLIIAEVIPFLVLAVGIDNVFLLVHAYDRTDRHLEVEDRVATALKLTGPNIVLTGLTELFAFGAGAFVTMPAVSSFSLYAVVAILCDFILQLTCFVAFLTIDGKRQKRGVFDILYCFRVNLHPLGASKRLLEKLMDRFYRKFILRPLVKPVILMAYVLFLFMMGVGIFYVQLGLDQRIAFPSNSYMISYFNALASDLLVGPPLYLVLRNYNVTNFTGQSHVISVQFHDLDHYNLGSMFETNRQSPESYISQPLSNWMDDFFSYLSSACEMDSETGELKTLDVPNDQLVSCLPRNQTSLYEQDYKGGRFLKYLQYFLQEPKLGNIPYGSLYESAIKLDLENVTVKASHFRTFFSVLKTQDDYINSLRAARKMCDDIKARNSPPGGPEFDIFPYSIFFVFFEQYLDITQTSFILVSVLLLAIFLTNWVLLGSILMALLVILMILSIVISLVGIMGWWSINLSAVSLVNIVIAIGISVEFCSNIARAYMVRAGTRTQRVHSTLVETGSSVFTGITVTKFLGVIVLVFSKSKIFEIFYFRMYFSVVLLGALHGLVILPILLSYIGPRYVLTTRPSGSVPPSLAIANLPPSETSAFPSPFSEQPPSYVVIDSAH